MLKTIHQITIKREILLLNEIILMKSQLTSIFQFKFFKVIF